MLFYRMVGASLGLLLICLTIPPGIAADQVTRARSLINAVADHADSILSEETTPLEVRERKLYSLIANNFHFGYITEFVVGPTWGTVPDKQRTEFTGLFKDFFIRSYGAEFGGYPGDTFIIVSVSEKGGLDSFVHSRLLRRGRPADSILWRVREFEHRPFIIDLIINGTSVALTHHQDFREILQNEGIDRLITLFKIRQERLSADAGGTGDGASRYRQGEFTEAFAIWERLAQDGNVQAAFNLSVMYTDGRGVTPDATRAKYWNDRALNSGYPPALHNQALRMLENGDGAKARQLLQQVGAKNFPASWHTLGKIYEYGIGVPEDPGKAFHCIEMAATAGLARAQYSLGKYYRDGYGVKRDEMAATKWFKSSAMLGYGEAQDKMAIRYATGQGVPKDNIEGLKWAILAKREGVEASSEKELFLRSQMSVADAEKAENLARDFELQ